MIDRLWAVDVEGSGKSPPEIIELAIAEMDGLILTGRVQHWRFRPKEGISPIASRIHGIYDHDVEDAPDIEDVASDIQNWLGDDPIIGHNVRVELALLSEAFEEWHPRAAYDSLKLARRLLPGQERHGLEHLGLSLALDKQAAKITGGKAHSATYDAVLSALLTRYLMEPLSAADRAIELNAADITRGTQGSLL